MALPVVNAGSVEENIHSYLVNNKITAFINFDLKKSDTLSYFIVTKIYQRLRIPPNPTSTCVSISIYMGRNLEKLSLQKNLLYQNSGMRIYCEDVQWQKENSWTYTNFQGLDEIVMGANSAEMPLQLISFINYYIHNLIGSNIEKTSSQDKNKKSSKKIFYFLFGYIDVANSSYFTQFKSILNEFFVSIKKKGYEYRLIANATINDFISVLNDGRAMSIYWLSHSLRGENVFHLIDYNMSKIPLSFFERGFTAPLMNLTLVSCFPEKLVKSYGLNTLSKIYGFNLFYSHGANDTREPGVVDNKDLLSFINSLPESQGHYEAAEATENLYSLEFDIADHFPNSTNYLLYFNDKLVASLPYNSKSGYERFKIPLKSPIELVRNRLKIVPEISSMGMPVDDILIRNISLSSPSREVLFPEVKNETHIGNDDKNVDLVEGLLLNYDLEIWKNSKFLSGPLLINFKQIP